MEPSSTPLAGRYLLGDAIGRGGSARVYRATDLRLGRQVAVKVLDEALAESVDPAARRRFEMESRTAATFTHPNAVTVFDAGSDDGMLFIVMELVAGGSLAERIARSGRLPGAEVARLGVEIASALSAAHSLGIVHRDVKPSNILFDDRDVAKLADFGIARRLDEIEEGLTSAGMVVGTRRYVSPEQAAGTPVGPSTDLFSLGLVLYEAVTGEPATPAADRRPGTGLNPRSIDPSIPAGLGSAIERATDMSVDGRPRDAAQFAQELAVAPDRSEVGVRADETSTMPIGLRPVPFTTEMTSSHEPLLAAGGNEPSPLSRRLGRERRRRRMVGVASAVAVCALVVATAAIGRGADSSDGGAASVPAASDGAPAIDAGDVGSSSAPVVTGAPETSTPSSTSSTTTSTSTSTTVAPPLDEAVAGFPATQDLSEFIGLLEARPEVAGDKAKDLARELDKLVDTAGDDDEKFDRDAEKVVDRIDKWVDDGDLDPGIADVARGFVDDLR